MKKIILLFISLQTCFLFSQKTTSSFLKPSDSLNNCRKKTVIISEATLASVALIGLNQLWYADYPKSNFHTINDANEWLQMDKVGHIFSSYQLGNLSTQTLNWSGVSKNNQLIYGATSGFVFLTAVEVFDGFSSQWGFSGSDIIANATGTGLLVSQELLWNEQRIVPKFSFHQTHFAQERSQVLGSSFSEQILKDYNGQTYWLSANLHSFFKKYKIPKWLNFAIGYGADGMLYSNSTILNPYRTKRQFYLSFDVDLTKIKTKSPILKTIFSTINCIKIPAPTIELSANSKIKVYFIYF